MDKNIDNNIIENYLEKEFFILITESDRGSILLGSSIIEHKFEEYFIKLIPKDIINDTKDKDSKRISKGNFNLYLNQSYLCRYIPYNLFKSINILKFIRNKIAHNSLSFELNTYKKEIRTILDLIGENLSYSTNKFSMELLIQNIAYKLLELKNPINNEPKFKNHIEVLDYIDSHKDLLNKVEYNSIKIEFSFCILYILRLISYHFEKAINILGDSKTISLIQH